MVGIIIGGLIGVVVDCHDGVKEEEEGIEKDEVKWENGDRDRRRYLCGGGGMFRYRFRFR